MTGYPIDRELRRYCLRMPFSSAILRAARLPMRMMYALTRIPHGVSHRVERTHGLRLDIFEPKTADEHALCLLYMHGGGFGYRAAPYHKRLAAEYAQRAGCRVICPDYRLTPRYPFPAAREDCLAAFDAVRRNYPDAAIAVGGDSAGAVLAADVVRGRQDAGIAFQLLVYPVCDAAQSTASMAGFTDTPLWDPVNNAEMWRLYLKNTGDVGRADASPMSAPLPGVIPDAYIELAEFDCLRDEGAAYAARLAAAGADVTLNRTRGTFHGYDIAQHARVTRENVARRVDFIKKHTKKGS